MAGKRKAEGIALLSLYNDEDMDVDDDMDDSSPVPSSPSPPPPLAVEKKPSGSPSPASPMEEERPSKGGLGIVDYAHDETAMSPEPEEGEIVSTGQAVYGQDLQVGNGVPQERTPPGIVQILTPGKVSTPQPVSLAEAAPKPESDTQSVNSVMTKEPEATSSPELNGVSKLEIEQQQEDPLADFLPPPPTTKCSEELQNKITKYIALKSAGRSFNKELRNSKGYRNPDFLQRAVKYQGIDQIGSCFRKEIFDPHGYDLSDYYDALAERLFFKQNSVFLVAKGLNMVKNLVIQSIMGKNVSGQKQGFKETLRNWCGQRLDQKHSSDTKRNEQSSFTDL